MPVTAMFEEVQLVDKLAHIGIHMFYRLWVDLPIVTCISWCWHTIRRAYLLAESA